MSRKKNNYEDDNFNYNPTLTPIKNSEQDINKMKLEKKFKFKMFRQKNFKRIINITFTVIIILICFIAIDTILVNKYEKGPIFAIHTKTYDDGGSKVYLGLGYKVIKYHQVQGRRDSELGLWSMNYNTEPIDVSDLDLAIEFEENGEKAFNRYYKKFLRISSTVKSVDKKNNKMVLEFNDEGDKYTLDIECTMADKINEISTYKKGDYVRVIGTVRKYAVHSESIPNTISISDCFSERQ